MLIYSYKKVGAAIDCGLWGCVGCVSADIQLLPFHTVKASDDPVCKKKNNRIEECIPVMMGGECVLRR